VLDYPRLEKIVVEHNIDKVVHLSALLSAVGERDVAKALKVNNGGVQNVLELAR
jgi:threonine 3-dehydrogenase